MVSITMADLQSLKRHADVLRLELSETETAIRVLERHAGRPFSEVKHRISDAHAKAVGFGGLSPGAEMTKWADYVRSMGEPGEELNCRSALVAMLKAVPQGMTKDEMRDGLKALGVHAKENTLTWTLSEYKDRYFTPKERGVWALVPGADLL